jgi:hypothetical protein
MPRDAEGLYQRIVNQDGSVLFVPVVLPVENNSEVKKA